MIRIPFLREIPRGLHSVVGGRTQTTIETTPVGLEKVVEVGSKEKSKGASLHGKILRRLRAFALAKRSSAKSEHVVKSARA